MTRLLKQFRGVLIACTTLFLDLVSGLPRCCVNSTSGVAFDECTCLTDNTRIARQSVRTGDSRLYHWVLSSNNSRLVSESPRGNLTFEMAPCNGSASFDIKSASPASWQYLPSFNSSESHNTASVTIPTKFTEHAMFVSTSVGTVVDLAVYTTLNERPTPGDDGRLVAEMPDSASARVIFNTTDKLGADDVQYRLHWATLAETGQEGCTLVRRNQTLNSNPNCMFWSVCGLEEARQGGSDWVTLDAQQTHTFEVDVDPSLTYLFNVVMLDADGLTSVYTGANVSFAVKTYQDCVGDPNCQSQLNDDSTLIAIAAASVSVLVALITVIKLLHSSIASMMREALITPDGGRVKFSGNLSSSPSPGIVSKARIAIDPGWENENDGGMHRTPPPTQTPRRPSSFDTAAVGNSMSNAGYEGQSVKLRRAPRSTQEIERPENAETRAEINASAEDAASFPNPQSELRDRHLSTSFDHAAQAQDGQAGWYSPTRGRVGVSGSRSHRVSYTPSVGSPVSSLSRHNTDEESSPEAGQKRSPQRERDRRKGGKDWAQQSARSSAVVEGKPRRRKQKASRR